MLFLLDGSRTGLKPCKFPTRRSGRWKRPKLRKIALGCYLTEELKWGKPCFTFLKKNVAIVTPVPRNNSIRWQERRLLTVKMGDGWPLRMIGGRTKPTGGIRRSSRTTE